jgi:hypothetical protein
MDREPILPQPFSTESPTPKQLYDQAQALEQTGDQHGAANLYDQAGHSYKAIQIFLGLGEQQKAYEIAKKSGDNWTADRLAYENSIPGHEYASFPKTEGDSFEGMRVALKSRMQQGATAERLGFGGFDGKVVADIGTRDGRFVSVFQELGAKEVYGIDPEEDELTKAVQGGVIDNEHAIPLMLQDIPNEIKSKFEVATIFNFNMPYTEYDSFFSAVYDSLPENGQVVMTVAEDEILRNATPTMQKYFVVNSTRLWGDKYDFPHKNLVVCTKKPELLVKGK